MVNLVDPIFMYSIKFPITYCLMLNNSNYQTGNHWKSGFTIIAEVLYDIKFDMKNIILNMIFKMCFGEID